MQIRNIAFYKFTDLGELPQRRVFFRDLCRRLALKGTIILSPEGINGFLAGENSSVQRFEAELKGMPEFADMAIKVSYSEKIPFQRMFVKLKKEIIPFGHSEIRPAAITGKRVSPEELRKWIDEGKDFWLLDTRNQFEVDAGTFRGARSFGLRNFRQFPEKLAEIPASLREKPVVMFCTGGIRCEKATAFAMQQGFKDVYQLDGGILNYFEKCGGAYYDGNCFVFDERIALNESLKETSGQG